MHLPDAWRVRGHEPGGSGRGSGQQYPGLGAALVPEGAVRLQQVAAVPPKEHRCQLLDLRTRVAPSQAQREAKEERWWWGREREGDGWTERERERWVDRERDGWVDRERESERWRTSSGCRGSRRMSRSPSASCWPLDSSCTSSSFCRRGRERERNSVSVC